LRCFCYYKRELTDDETVVNYSVGLTSVMKACFLIQATSHQYSIDTKDLMLIKPDKYREDYVESSVEIAKLFIRIWEN